MITAALLLGAWLAAAAPLGVVVGRSIRLADQRAAS